MWTALLQAVPSRRPVLRQTVQVVLLRAVIAVRFQAGRFQVRPQEVLLVPEQVRLQREPLEGTHSTMIVSTTGPSLTSEGDVLQNSTRRDKSVITRHKKNLVYVVVPVVCFLFFICVIAVICILKQTREKEKRTLRFGANDPERPNFARKGRGIVRHETKGIGQMPKLDEKTRKNWMAEKNLAEV